MLLLAAAALVMPAIYEMVEGSGLPQPGAERVHYDSTVQGLSAAVACVLILSYVAGLWFSLKTHRDLFNPRPRGPATATASRGRCASRSSRWASRASRWA